MDTLNGNTIEKSIANQGEVLSYHTNLTGKTVSMVKLMVDGTIQLEFEDGTMWEIGANMVCRITTKVHLK